MNANVVPRKLRCIGLLSALLASNMLLTACGGGDGNGGTTTHGVGGQVTVLKGTPMLLNNGTDDLKVTADGPFTFATAIAASATCAVTVDHTVGGTVSGLLGVLVLRNNGADDLPLLTDGAFAFAGPVPHGSPYAVTVATQPVGQVCSVSQGSGTAVEAVADVAVGCVSNSSGTLALLAGDMGGPGNFDGARGLARFRFPTHLAIDGAGNLYVSDTFNHTVRKIAPAGGVTTLAGLAGSAGSADGTGATARFSSPRGVAVDAAGNVFVADAGNLTVRRITPHGVVSTVAGQVGVAGGLNGAGTAAQFRSPRDVAIDAAGNLYVADAGNHNIRKITPAGVVSDYAGGSSLVPGVFNAPGGLTIDTAGTLFVAETGRHVISRVLSTGQVQRVAGQSDLPGSVDGTTAARFNEPQDVAVDAAGNIYVADTPHTVRKITPAGVVSTLAGTAGEPGSTDGTGSAARFDAPRGIAATATGIVFVGDGINNLIRRIDTAAAVSTFAGAAAQFGDVEGTSATARFDGVSGVTIDAGDNAIVVDSNNASVRTVTAAGATATLAGRKGCFGSADGFGTAACFSAPSGVAIDAAGNIFVADSNHNTIRKVTPAGQVSTLAGRAASFGYVDGIGVAARFNSPRDIAIDSGGNLYVTENGHAVRKISPAGVVTTFAGVSTAFGTSDGLGSVARFSNPTAIATDALDSVYVADSGNITIRKIAPDGHVSTFAGAPGQSGSVDATGAQARFGRPNGLSTDAAGNLYVADSANHTIRKITPAGVVSTVVGVSGREGFVPGPLPGVLSLPIGIEVRASSLFITMGSGVAVVHGLP